MDGSKKTTSMPITSYELVSFRHLLTDIKRKNAITAAEKQNIQMMSKLRGPFDQSYDDS